MAESVIFFAVSNIRQDELSRNSPVFEKSMATHLDSWKHSTLQDCKLMLLISFSISSVLPCPTIHGKSRSANYIESLQIIMIFLYEYFNMQYSKSSHNLSLPSQIL